MKTGEVIRLVHDSSHPPAKVWNALTDPGLHARWWAAGDVRAVVGHRFELDMGKWGKQPCEVLAVEHERVLKYRFGTAEHSTVITWELAPAGSGTRLTLTHEGFDLDTPIGRQALAGMKPGWPRVVARLELLLDSEAGRADDPAPPRRSPRAGAHARQPPRDARRGAATA